MRRLDSLLLSCAIAAASMSPASATERVGDATHVQALRWYEAAVRVLERDALALVERTPDDERFFVYSTYDRVMGAWSQVALAQELLEQAIATTDDDDEDALRTTLRDQLRFAVADLDEARGALELPHLDVMRSEHRALRDSARTWLSDVVRALVRLLADQCAPSDCASSVPTIN